MLREEFEEDRMFRTSLTSRKGKAGILIIYSVEADDVSFEDDEQEGGKAAEQEKRA